MALLGQTGFDPTGNAVCANPRSKLSVNKRIIFCLFIYWIIIKIIFDKLVWKFLAKITSLKMNAFRVKWRYFLMKKLSIVIFLTNKKKEKNPKNLIQQY